MTYAQCGEDEIVMDYFGGRIGVYVDVGAFDGVTNSNTYALQLAGWRGVCVEPSPIAFNRLVEKRLSFATECVQCACVDKSDVGIMPFVLLDSIPQFSGLSPDHEKIKRECDVMGVTVHPMVINVQAVTLDEVLYQSVLGINQIDFISIDTEGTELDVLRGFDLDRWKPQLLCVECNDWRSVGLNGYLVMRGYRVLHTMEINTIFERI